MPRLLSFPSRDEYSNSVTVLELEVCKSRVGKGGRKRAIRYVVPRFKLLVSKSSLSNPLNPQFPDATLYPDLKGVLVNRRAKVVDTFYSISPDAMSQLYLRFTLGIKNPVKVPSHRTQMR